MLKNSAELYTDGGARGNPGPAGIGIVLKLKTQNATAARGGGAPPKAVAKRKTKKYIGEATNNQAEYRALIAGLELAKAEGVEELKVFMDSELIVKQMRGEYRVKNPDLKPLFASALALTNKFTSVSFHHIPREKNKAADKLVNEAIDQVTDNK